VREASVRFDCLLPTLVSRLQTVNCEL